jgi:hypothetical protein
MPDRTPLDEQFWLPPPAAEERAAANRRRAGHDKRAASVRRALRFGVAGALLQLAGACAGLNPVETLFLLQGLQWLAEQVAASGGAPEERRRYSRQRNRRRAVRDDRSL